MRAWWWMCLLTGCGWFGTGGGSTPSAVPAGELPPDTRYASDVPLDEGLRCEVGKSGYCFVLIPETTFAMGAQASDPSAPGYDPLAAAHEGPVHEVTVGPFRIHRREVSISSYITCVEDGACRREDVLDGVLPGADEPARSGPLHGVDWAGAQAFCTWMGGRLPTEAEWELAARGTDGRRWPWGNVPKCGAHRSGSALRDAPSPDEPDEACAFDGVIDFSDQRGRSPYGLEGMGGSLWEWTADWYAADAYAHHDAVRPKGPPTGTTRVQRGGGWAAETPADVRAAMRGALDPTQQLPDVGLRCVRDPVVGE